MTHTVRLSKNDQYIMIKALYESQLVKERKLVRKDSLDLMIKQYMDAAEKMLEPITIHDRNKNLMVWFIDQMKHSGKLWDTELCVAAVNIANKVITNEYDHYKSVEIFTDLFEDSGA